MTSILFYGTRQKRRKWEGVNVLRKQKYVRSRSHVEGLTLEGKNEISRTIGGLEILVQD